MANTLLGSMKDPTSGTDPTPTILKKIISGRLNVTGVFNPDDGASSTLLYHPSIGVNSSVLLFPITATSAAVAGKFSEDQSARASGAATMRHPIFATGANFKFMFLVIG